MGLKRLSDETVTNVVSSDVKLLITQNEVVEGNEENVVRRAALAKIAEKMVDETLTKSGTPADAKAVGDAIVAITPEFSVDENNAVTINFAPVL